MINYFQFFDEYKKLNVSRNHKLSSSLPKLVSKAILKAFSDHE